MKIPLTLLFILVTTTACSISTEQHVSPAYMQGYAAGLAAANRPETNTPPQEVSLVVEDQNMTLIMDGMATQNITLLPGSKNNLQVRIPLYNNKSLGAKTFCVEHALQDVSVFGEEKTPQPPMLATHNTNNRITCFSLFIEPKPNQTYPDDYEINIQLAQRYTIEQNTSTIYFVLINAPTLTTQGYDVYKNSKDQNAEPSYKIACSKEDFGKVLPYNDEILICKGEYYE